MDTILLVDDESEVRDLAREILEAHGYRILEAASAEQALEVSRRHPEPIALLLTDVVMPGMHGHELAAQLRIQRPETKVLYMTGFALVQAQHEMLSTRAGLEPGSPLLPKPFSSEGLARKVGEVLATRTAAPRSPFARGHAAAPSADPWWP
jgi:two-component system, cell cycle sensor histidine kinase and response regulator CckA